jgi:hypothetical protein
MESKARERGDPMSDPFCDCDTCLYIRRMTWKGWAFALSLALLAALVVGWRKRRKLV